MKAKHWIACALCATFGASAYANVISSGWSAERYSASSTAANGGSAEHVFNGGSWNAGAGGDQWIQVDLGTTHWIDGFGFRTNQSPPGVNTVALYISNTAIGSGWNSLVAAAGNSAYSTSGTHFDIEFAPAKGRYVEIVVQNADSWAALDLAYFSGALVTGGVAAAPENGVPEPASLALLGLGALLMAGRRRPRCA
jgi:hypothetical protein